jgi:tetratricopeptide (TPR) repeat protein
LAAIGFGLWYGLAPPVPVVTLPEGTDPAMVEAVSRARWAIRRAPWSAERRAQLAMLLHSISLNAEAGLFYAQAERLAPTEPRWPYLHAFVMGDDPPAALALLRRAVELAGAWPDAPNALLYKMADTCLNQGQLDEAQEAYRRLLEKSPDHARAHLGLARLAIRRGQMEEALTHLEVCGRHQGTRRTAAGLMAEVQQRRGDAAAASRAAQQMAELPPDQHWPDAWLAEVHNVRVGRKARLLQLQELQQQGRQNEATELMRKTIVDYPDLGWVFMAQVRRKQGNLEEAEKAARSGLKHNPNYVEGHFELGVILVAQKRFADAAGSFRRVIELEPAHEEAYRALARCALAGGDRAEAQRCLAQVLQYTPHDAMTHRDLAQLLAEDGRRDEAVAHLQHALRLTPDDAKARELLEKLQGGKEKAKP